MQLKRADPAEGVEELYEGRSNDSAEWRGAVARVREALRNGEFRLYGQTIEDLWTGDASFQGIFVRQAEEEKNRLPPGAFFALAEEFSLLRELDRWVVARVLRHEAERRRAGGSVPSMYCIHVSRDSIADPYFPDFVKEQIGAARVLPEVLCLEIQEADVRALRTDSADMARQLRRAGVHVMLGGFGRDERASLLLWDVPVDFLKIDGSLVLNIARSDSALATLRAIVREAHALGINAVAELAESSEVVARLREIEVDYAQGVAVSPALPLWDAAQLRSQRRTSA
jgi:EAL domain-containing protein (putative c-di-GMP-specific phosphodiesterase class I)